MSTVTTSVTLGGALAQNKIHIAGSNMTIRDVNDNIIDTTNKIQSRMNTSISLAGKIVWYYSVYHFF